MAAAVERAATRGIAVVALKLGRLRGRIARRALAHGIARRRARRLAGVGARGGPPRGDRARPSGRDGGPPRAGAGARAGRAWRWRRLPEAWRCCSPTRSSRAASRSPRWRTRPRGAWRRSSRPTSTSRTRSTSPPGLPDATFGEVLTTVARDPGIDVVVVPLTMATAGAGSSPGRARHHGRARRDEAPGRLLARGAARARRGSARWRRPGCPLFPTVSSCAAALGAALALRAAPGAAAPAAGPASCRSRAARGRRRPAVAVRVRSAGRRRASRGAGGDRSGRRARRGRRLSAPPLSRRGEGAWSAPPDRGRRRAAGRRPASTSCSRPSGRSGRSARRA